MKAFKYDNQMQCMIVNYIRYNDGEESQQQALTEKQMKIA